MRGGTPVVQVAEGLEGSCDKQVSPRPHAAELVASVNDTLEMFRQIRRRGPSPRGSADYSQNPSQGGSLPLPQVPHETPHEWVEYLKEELVRAVRAELRQLRAPSGQVGAPQRPTVGPAGSEPDFPRYDYEVREELFAGEDDVDNAPQGNSSTDFRAMPSNLRRLNKDYREEEQEWNIRVRQGVGGIAPRAKSADATWRRQLGENHPYLNQMAHQSWSRRFVSHPAFEIVVMLAILTDAVVAGIVSDMEVKDLKQGVEDRKWLLYLAVGGLSLFFLIELIVRIYSYRLDFFIGRSWQSNWFDLIMVVVAIPSLIDEDMSWTIILRTARVCRMMRLTVIIRALNLFASLRLMVTSIYNTLSLVAWAFFFTLAVIYIFSLFFLAVVRTHLHDAPPERLAAVNETTLFQLYNGIERSMLTLYYVITGGMEWSYAVAPLEAIDKSLTYVFGLYMFGTLYGILSIIVGLFCERAQSLSNLDRGLLIQQTKDEQEELLQNMTKVFKEMDTERKGEITWSQFRAFIQDEEIQAYFTAQGLNPLDARALFQLLDEIDSDPNGAVDLSSFLLGVLRLTGPARSTDLVTLVHETRKNHEALYIMMQEVHQILGVIKSPTHAST